MIYWRIFLKLWPVWLMAGALSLGWMVRGWYEDSERVDTVEEHADEATETGKQESKDQEKSEGVSREITEKIGRGRNLDKPVSPELDCVLRAVEARRPPDACMRDRVPSPAVSLGAIVEGQAGDGAGRSATGRVP